MLIDKKFIYLSLPRCGSTSFHYSCLLHNLSVKNLPSSKDWEINNKQVNFNNIDEKNIMNFITHGHEKLNDLQSHFGYNYPIIAVNRERHERFYSLYKHVIFEFYRCKEVELADLISKWTIDELFSFSTKDIYNKESRWEFYNNYLLEKNIIKIKGNPINTSYITFDNKNFSSYEEFWSKYRHNYIVSILDLLITPSTFWHNNDKNIIWFDINNLKELEEWVSNKIKKPFEIKKVNSSQYIDCKIKLDDDFIKKYDNIYDYYDLQKKEKTLI